MKSWKTTTLGILAIVTVAVNVAQALIAGQAVDWGTVIPAVMAGVGLITAKDANVTGGTVKQ